LINERSSAQANRFARHGLFKSCYMRYLAVCLCLLTGPAVTLANQLNDSVDAYVRKEMQQRQIPGLAVAVIQRAKIQHVAVYGYADLGFSIPVRTTMLFSIASVTKTVTAVAIMKLQEAGKLSVEDPVGRYITGLPESWRVVRLRYLMSHTSGIPDVMANSFALDTVADTPKQMFQVFANRPLDFPPGSQWRYNQANYMLLGLIIEKITGQAFPSYCRDQLFAPIGVTAIFGYSPLPIPNRTHLYTILNWAPTGVTRLQQVQLKGGRVLPSMLWPAGGLNLSVTDFARWLIALESGKVIRRASLEQLWMPTKLIDGATFEQAPDQPWHTIGLGWGVASDEGHRRVGFSGGTFATFFVYPENDLSVVVLTNMEGSDPESLAKNIAKRYLAATKLH